MCAPRMKGALVSAFVALGNFVRVARTYVACQSATKAAGGSPSPGGEGRREGGPIFCLLTGSPIIG